MNFLYSIFGYLFRILFSFVENYGIALVIFSLFFRLILLPTSVKQQKSSAKMVRLQPKLKRIREKYQDYTPQEKQQRIQQETNELYQREGYSSMGASCLPLLIQMPVLMGLYGIIRMPLTYVLNFSEEAIKALTDAATTLQLSTGKAVAYAESIVISNIDKIVEGAPEVAAKYAAEIAAIKDFDFTIFGIDLGSIPSNIFAFAKADGFTLASILVIAVPVLSGLTSLLTSVLSQVRQKKANPNMENQQMMGCMMIMMPLWSVWLTWSFPVGMGMYWILSNVFAFLQTLILGHVYAPRKTIAKLMVEETVYRRSYEKTKKIATSKTED